PKNRGRGWFQNCHEIPGMCALVHLMHATKYFVLASFLLTAVDGFGQARKARPSEGLSIGSLNGSSQSLNIPSLSGPSLPLSWPFKPREPEFYSIPPFIVPGTRPEPPFLPPRPEKTEPG